MWVAGIVVFFIGLVLIISYSYNKRKNARCIAQTQGVLSNVRARYNSEGSLKDAHVYTYHVNGIEYRLATTDHSPQAERIGDTCTIWYNPTKPKDAQAYRGTDSYLRKFLIIGLAMVPVGIVLFFIGVIWL